MCKRQPKYYGSAAFDYWPPQDWFRFRYKHYGKRSWQLTFGPLRIDFDRN